MSSNRYMRKGLPHWLVMLMALGALGNIALRVVSESTLYNLSFQSGWLLALLLVLATLPWWFPGPRMIHTSGSVHFHPLLLSGLGIALFAHTGLQVPHGWVERILFLVFVGFAISTLIGRAHLRRSLEDGAEVTSRWLHVQSIVTSVLLTLALFHGVFLHAHGALAHLFLGR